MTVHLKQGDVISDDLGRVWELQEHNRVKITEPDGKVTWILKNGAVSESTPASPEFRQGNLARMTHGSRSEAVIAMRSQEFCEKLFQDCAGQPWIEAADELAIEQLCRTEARARLIDEYIAQKFAEHGLSALEPDERGTARIPSSLLAEATKADMAAQRFAESLGLTPTGRLKIRKDLGWVHHFDKERLGGLIDVGQGILDKETSE